MEQRSLLASAVGVGVGVGLDLASARWGKPAAHAAEGCGGAGAAEVEAELRRLVVDNRDSDVNFDEFHHLHCYLSEQTKEVLISAAFVHLKQADLSKHIRNLAAASRAILLSGPTEPYLQSLARALSHYYKARLLLLDVTDFSLRIQSKYGSSSKALVHNQSISETTFGMMSDFIGSFTMFPKKDDPRGNGEDYVSDDFVAEAMDKMEAAVSRIADLRSNSQLPSIYQVSTGHNGNYENDGIKPVAVRIGLLNWSEQEQSKEKLQDYKWYCVQQLINLHSSVLEPSRTPLLLRKCLNTMIHMESEIRQFYSRGDVILIDSNRLALTMLLDGCFILHRLLKYAHVRENEADSTERLYGSPQEWELVKRDLLLFENQIPFLVLRKLLDKLEIDDESEHNLVKGSLRLFRSSCCCSRMLRSECLESDMACDQVHHLLHLFYLSLALPPKPSDPAAHVSLSIDPPWIFCTTDLEEAGVRFRKRENAESLLDIKFDHGVLEIPPLLLDDFSKLLFRNLIVFEKSYTTWQCISNYAAFMDDLMQTPKDRKILRWHGILVNMRDTSSFFNGTCIRMLLPSDNYLVELMENLRKYKDSRRHEWRADLMRSYFRNPWVAISVLAAAIVLVMAVLQTVFTVYGYYKPRK